MEELDSSFSRIYEDENDKMEELDSRFHGNDKKTMNNKIEGLDSRFPRIHEDENDKMEVLDSSFSRIYEDENDKIEELDSRFHGNDKKTMNNKIENFLVISYSLLKKSRNLYVLQIFY